MKVIDKANGYIYGGLSEQGDDVMAMMSNAVGADFSFGEYLFTKFLYTYIYPSQFFLSKLSSLRVRRWRYLYSKLPHELQIVINICYNPISLVKCLTK